TREDSRLFARVARNLLSPDCAEAVCNSNDAGARDIGTQACQDRQCVALREVEREAGSAWPGQSSEGDAGVEDPDDSADVSSAEVIHHYGGEQCYPAAIEEAIDECEQAELPGLCR